jgi:hypothetical protein
MRLMERLKEMRRRKVMEGAFVVYSFDFDQIIDCVIPY